MAEDCKISNFAVLLANGWIRCCGESDSVERAEDEDETVVDAEPKPGDTIAICSVNTVGLFFPESNLPGLIFDMPVQVQGFSGVEV